MRRRVYRSLDHPAAAFGIRGRFLWVMGIGGAIALIVGMVAGAVSSMIMGFGAGLAAAMAAYFVTVGLQGRIDEKDLLKTIARRAYPSLYRVRPKHLRNLWRGFNLQGPYHD